MKIIFKCILKPANLVTKMQFWFGGLAHVSSPKKEAKQKEELVPGNVTSRASALKEAIRRHRQLVETLFHRMSSSILIERSSLFCKCKSLMQIILAEEFLS